MLSRARAIDQRSDAVASARTDVRDALSKAFEGAKGNPVLILVRKQLETSSAVAAAGPPPLSQVAAQATGEMLAYGLLLKAEPRALPESIDPKVAAKLRDAVSANWSTAGADVQKLFCNAPATWMVARTESRFGDVAGQAVLREQLKTLACAAPSAAAGTNAASSTAGTASFRTGSGATGAAAASASGSPKPMAWATFGSMQAIQQMTLENWRFYHGYNSSFGEMYSTNGRYHW